MFGPRRNADDGPAAGRFPHAGRWDPYRPPGKNKKAGDFTLISVYGYVGEGPAGRNRAWIGEIAAYTAGLRNAHLVAGGDWNITPDEWDEVGGRRLGVLLATGRPTCFPARGEHTEKNFFLVNPCLRAAVADYEFMPVGILPTHRAIKLTLNLVALREPVRSLRKPRTIPHPEPDQQRPQEAWADGDPQEPGYSAGNPG